MLFTDFAFVFTLLIASAVARPAEKRWGGGGWGGGSWGGGSWGGSSPSEDGWGEGDNHHWWQPSKASSYLGWGKRGGAVAGTTTCDLTGAVGNMNLGAASPPLPAPAADLTLFHVAIGRGTQNYTCDLTNATATPVPVGAVATLFNASCIAADMPALLDKLPGIALDLPIPTSDDVDSPILQDLSGHHYFIDSTTPFFNMDTPLNQYGMGALAKTNTSTAPANAIVGQNNQGDGACSWLKLDMQPFAEDDWKAVYRLNTAGGNAPTTCTNQAAAFEVQYAAEYWIFT